MTVLTDEATTMGRTQIVPNWVYLAVAILFGSITATLQEFPVGRAEWIGAAAVPLVIGLVVGWIVRLFRKSTNGYKVAFWWSVVALIIAGLSPGR